MDASLQLFSEDPRVWVLDNAVSSTFLNAVDAAFDSEDVDRDPFVKHNGRVTVRRNVNLEVEELSHELFQTISRVCSLKDAMPRHNRLLVTEVCGQGRHAHTDHVNLDKVTAGPTDFLDLSRQSAARENARNIVPTVSVVLYLNDVGGIRFPYAKGVDIVAGRRGRMILFENYDDASRPYSKESATHYGVYFEALPKRVLVMGVLANGTPHIGRGQGLRAAQAAEPTAGLIYCAGTGRDDPLFHGERAWTPPTPPRARKPEPLGDLIVSLETSLVEKDKSCLVVGRSMAGNELCRIRCGSQQTLRVLREEIKRKVDPDDRYNVILCRLQGQLLVAEQDGQRLALCFKGTEVEEHPVPAAAVAEGANGTAGSGKGTEIGAEAGTPPPQLTSCFPWGSLRGLCRGRQSSG